MDSSSFENAKQIAGTEGKVVAEESKQHGNSLNFEPKNKKMAEVPKEMIKTRLKMGLTPPK